MSTVMEIYKLTLEEYSFIMWAGMYDFFDKKDFYIFNRGVEVSFYIMIRKMINKGYVVVVGSKTGETRKVFALTGTGVSLYNKIAKFTNKFLIDAGTSDIRRGVQNTSSS
jgi:DNA-binding PadR family transcriptional regulator